MHKKKAIFITLILLSLVSILLIFFAIKSYNILLSPAESTYGFGAYGVGAYGIGESFQQISSQNNNQQTSSTSSISDTIKNTTSNGNVTNKINVTSQNKTDNNKPIPETNE